MGTEDLQAPDVIKTFHRCAAAQPSLYKPETGRNRPGRDRMQETPHATLHLDEPPQGATHAAGRVVCRGWLVGKPAHGATDLRVRIGERCFPASLGFPRPDLAAFFKAHTAQLPAGFEVSVELAEGTNRLEFEFASVQGAWLPLTGLELTATPGGPAPAPAPPANPPVLESAGFERAQEWLMAAPDRREWPVLAGQLAAALPVPQVTRFSPLPFHGHLHLPQAIQETLYGRLIVEGWLFHEHARIRRILGTVDLQAMQELRQEGGFPYVAAMYPAHPQGAACRFHGYLDVPAQLPQPVSVRIYAELEDGSLHLCHIQRCFTVDAERQKIASAQSSPLATRQVQRVLRAALAARGWQTPAPRALAGTIARDWLERLRAAIPTHQAIPPGAPGQISAAAPPRVALFTHNLQFEGAPLFLLEYARWLKSAGWSVTLFSPRPGPLQPACAAVVDQVELIDPGELQTATTPAAWHRALHGLGSRVPLGGFDLVVANTLSAWWVVHLAQCARCPSLLYIHESNTPERFFHGHAPCALLPLVRQTFALATHVSFLTEATRRYYRHVLPRHNHSINPGWIDLAGIDRHRAEHQRTALRGKLGLPASGLIAVNVGTVCDRKGQHVFARAVDQLMRAQPEVAAQVRFLMVGGRDTSFDRTLAELVDALDYPNLAVVRETPTPYDYYGAADLFVCSSYEESFPRVLLEAMAFALPIVSTGVHGIPEIARDGLEALLVPAGDTAALARGLGRLLSDPQLAGQLARAARARVTREYDAACLLPQHAKLAAGLLKARR